MLETKSDKSFSSCASVTWVARGSMPQYAISGWVMVPVLSTHSTSTRASVSVHLRSCTKVFWAARRRTLAASARLTIRYSPSGIIPMTAAAVVSTPSLRERPNREVCR